MQKFKKKRKQKKEKVKRWTTMRLLPRVWSGA